MTDLKSAPRLALNGRLMLAPTSNFLIVEFRGCPQEHGIAETQIQDREALAAEHDGLKSRAPAPWRHGLERLVAAEWMTYDPPS